MSKKSLISAINLAGTQMALAAAVRRVRPSSKISQAHISVWINSPNEDVMPPAEWVIPICEALDWKTTPNELRSDLYPHQQDGIPAELRNRVAA